MAYFNLWRKLCFGATKILNLPALIFQPFFLGGAIDWGPIWGAIDLVGQFRGSIAYSSRCYKPTVTRVVVYAACECVGESNVRLCSAFGHPGTVAIIIGSVPRRTVFELRQLD